MTAERSAVPLYRKLGIRPGSRVAFVNAPDDMRIDALLGDVPDGVRFFERAAEPLDVIVFFAESERHLRRRFHVLATFLATAGGLWVAYAKRSSPQATDLSFGLVQQIGLDHGLVDNKSCAVDDDWSAVRFVRRLQDR